MLRHPLLKLLLPFPLSGLLRFFLLPRGLLHLLQVQADAEAVRHGLQLAVKLISLLFRQSFL